MSGINWKKVSERLPHASGREHPEQLLARNLVMWWIGRALVEDTIIGEVLDALHARSNRLLYLHLIGNVADQRQADLLRLVGDGKERLALAALTTMIVGIVPAWNASRQDLANRMKESGKD
jgi:hypothetical protein